MILSLMYCQLVYDYMHLACLTFTYLCTPFPVFYSDHPSECEQDDNMGEFPNMFLFLGGFS